VYKPCKKSVCRMPSQSRSESGSCGAESDYLVSRLVP
jgi:hypothetical protein